MKQVLVSVIIPCYNQGNYLGEAIDSVLASSYKNVEIVVVDDGSTIYKNLLNDFQSENIRIIYQHNQGVASARNNAIKAAKGKYILPLDADDKIHENYIQKAVELMESDADLGIVYCDAELFGSICAKWEIPEYAFPDILGSNTIFSSAFLKKSDWEKVGGYKVEMNSGFEDWEFWLSLIETGVKVHKIPERLFFYRQHNQSRTADLIKKNSVQEMIVQIIRLHPNLYAQNLDKVLLPICETIDGLKYKKGFVSWSAYKIRKCLRKILFKLEKL